VADIAKSHLTETTRRHIRELLGNDDFAAISTWADEVRAERPETLGWHFVDIPPNATSFSQVRDCYRPDEKHPPTKQDHHNCVVDRIEMFQQVLWSNNESQAKRVEALKFLVHFVADINQPLHAIAEARGGNDIHVTEFGSPRCGSGSCNLHSAWDTGLIEHAGRSEPQYVAYLEKLISHRHLPRGADGTPETWANQSFLGAESLAERWRSGGRSLFPEEHREPKREVGARRAAFGKYAEPSLGEVTSQLIELQAANQRYSMK
jgi:hypothetical protein